MKLHWTGSDVLYATYFLGRKFPTKKSKLLYFACMTIFAKIADFFVEGHYVVSEHLVCELQPLKLRKPIKVLVDPPKCVKTLKMIPHEGFNVLYYFPKSNNDKFNEWVYGWDIFEEVVRDVGLSTGTVCKTYLNEIPVNGNGINFIIVNGTADIMKIYSITNVYIRINRHDGRPRMVDECVSLGIPCYASENPDKDDIVNFINKSYAIRNRILKG